MSRRELSRRGFLGTAAASLAGAAGSTPQSQTLAKSPGSGLPAQYGEPYQLAGNRLYFHNWHYIRPGSFEWKGEDGRNVGLKDAVAPGAARLAHTDQPWGIRIVAQRAERVGPILRPERPWEQGGSMALTCMIQDAGMYRAWGGHFVPRQEDVQEQSHSFYMESSDGLEWKRPNLGLVEFKGSRANNLYGGSGGTPFVDPSAPPAERYKSIGMDELSPEICEEYFRRRPNDWDSRADRRSNGRLTGLTGSVSPDGLRWKTFREPLVVLFSDTQVIAYYDEALGKYVAYTRAWVLNERSPRVPDGRSELFDVGRRSIGRAESANFRQFPVPETILEPGPNLLPSDALYTNCKTTVPGAPDHHLLFPTVWHTASDSTSITVASSHDGRLWHWVPGAPVFTTGPFGAFDGGCVFAHPNLLELPDGRFVLPYTGYNVPHKYPRGQYKYSPGYALWPKGRVIALEARAKGEFATMGLAPPGRKLRINALVLRGGSIQVEVADLRGKPLPGRSFAEAAPIIGDHHWTTLSWNGQDDLGHKDGMGIMLRFRMDQAQLFGLEFV
jgi:hypothetical protein